MMKQSGWTSAGGQRIFLPAPTRFCMTAGVTGVSALLRKTEALCSSVPQRTAGASSVLSGGYFTAGAA